MGRAGPGRAVNYLKCDGLRRAAAHSSEKLLVRTGSRPIPTKFDGPGEAAAHQIKIAGPRPIISKFGGPGRAGRPGPAQPRAGPPASAHDKACKIRATSRRQFSSYPGSTGWIIDHTHQESIHLCLTERYQVDRSSGIRWSAPCVTGCTPHFESDCTLQKPTYVHPTLNPQRFVPRMGAFSPHTNVKCFPPPKRECGCERVK